MGEEKSVKLCRANANHVETLLKVLEYDGRVERLPVFATAMFVLPADDPDRKKAKKRKRYSDESDSGHKRNDRHRKRRKRDSSSDAESTDDRSSKRKRGYSKRKKYHSTSDSEGSGPRSDDDITRAHSWSSKKSRSRSTHSYSRSDSPKLVEMDAIEASLYRAIRPQIHNQATSACLAEGREMGVEEMVWVRAPCVKCPQAEFCKEGGPVNASVSGYFREWMDPVGFGRVSYVDEDLKMSLIVMDPMMHPYMHPPPGFYYPSPPGFTMQPSMFVPSRLCFTTFCTHATCLGQEYDGEAWARWRRNRP